MTKPLRLPLSTRLALRDLRGGLGSFRLFLACLFLGILTLAGAGSFDRAVKAGLADNARTLLGGDLAVRLLHRLPTDAEQASLDALGPTTRVAELRTMARPEADATRRVLVQLKAVDPAYPLVGTLTVQGPLTLAQALAAVPGEPPGAVVAPTLAARLGVGVGDRLRIGDATVVLRAFIAHEPDALAGAFQMGPRVMIAADTLAQTGLIRPGSLVEYTTLIRLPQGISPATAKATLTRAHPEAGWRIRGPDEASTGVQSFLDRLVLFLVLVGLATLLVGGIGVANAITAHLEGRRPTLAILKSVGASSGLVYRVVLTQVALMTGLALALGLGLGAALPALAIEALGDALPLPARAGVYPGALALAAGFGMLSALLFTWIPLARARALPAAFLLRPGAEALLPPPLPWRDRGAVALTALALVGLAVATASDPRLAGWFVAGTLAAFALFRGVAALLMAGVRRLPLPARPTALRLGLAAVARPGASTPTVVVSLGLGLSVLVTIAVVERSLNAHIAQGLPERAPGFFLLDIQPDQVDPVRAAIETSAPTATLQMADMVRGRLLAVNGVPINEETVAPDARWAVRGDRGFTTAATLPTGSTLVRGAWWPADYQGPPLFSVTEDIARGMALKLGDTITVTILGRALTGTLAATRRVDWTSLGMNFAFVVSPGAFAGAPRTWIATVHAPAAELGAIEQAVGGGFSNVSIIDVREVLAQVGAILGQVSRAVQGAAALTLVTGVLVLAGAFAATQRRRLREAVTLKVLGATRPTLAAAFAVEYGLMGLAAGLIASGVGVGAAWAILRFGLSTPLVVAPGGIAALVSLALVLSLATGFAGTGRALGIRAAPLLRDA
ncbi:ABC transporter permease [Pararhodospirillum oryzae]|uniref:Glycosyl transferase family 1 n=1 Tax=Pararhodospirillum oryzae TaxID=478448 RepID=A0A512H653_9PROT|nr:FtsX-like permease family protein [Pararhodospirillum oryzae]GEO80922.1 glycosyl transferase family 1 [Pararhodospirillum oryzae]